MIILTLILIHLIGMGMYSDIWSYNKIGYIIIVLTSSISVPIMIGKLLSDIETNTIKLNNKN